MLHIAFKNEWPNNTLQNNEEQGREFIGALAQPGIEATARSIVEKCSHLLEEPPSELVS